VTARSLPSSPPRRRFSADAPIAVSHIVAVTFAVAFLVAPCAVASQAAPTPLRICVGHVQALDGAAVPDATVTFTPNDGETSPSSAHTNANGDFRLACVAIPSGYTVRITRLGFASQWRALDRVESGLNRVDFTLQPVVQQLAPVQTRAIRPRPIASTNGPRQPPGADLTVLNSTDRADPTGDLQSALAGIPELSLTPTGASAFGAGADQNGTTLNGMEHGGALPRDGLSQGVYLSTYDPRQGRFAGVQVAYTLASGADRRERILHFTGLDPLLELGGSSGANFSGPATRNILSGAVSGPINPGKRYFSTAFQIDRSTAALSPLDAGSPAMLDAMGANVDSVARLLDEARALGLPLSARSVLRQSTTGSIAARVDLMPGGATRMIVMGDTPQDQLYLLASAGWNSVGGLGLTPTATASLASASHHADAQLMGEYLTYRFASALIDSKVSVSVANDGTRPSLSMPAATVLVSTTSTGGVSGFVPLQLGGGSGITSEQHDVKLDANTDLSWYTFDGAHRFDVFASGQAESYRSERSVNGFGTFAFNSIADFAADAPASFDRSLGTAGSTVPAARGVLALSDIYTPGRGSAANGISGARLTIQYGLRVDAEHYGGAPAYSALVDSTFGRRTDRIPGAVSVQPMAGFTWNVGRYFAEAGDGIRASRIRDVVTGGVRDYRSALPLSTIASVAQQNGLPGSVVDVRCVDGAVPSPTWDDFLATSASIPSECAGGAPSVLSQYAPGVALFSNGYTPFENWRGQLKLVHEFRPSLSATLGAVVSRGSHGADMVDLNFVPDVRFTLPAEANRPVFVSPTSVVGSTGAMSSIESRRSTDFARVADWRSDLWSSRAQMTAQLAYSFGGHQLFFSGVEAIPPITGNVRLAYTYATGTSETRGFGGTTGGNPLDLVVAPDMTPTHSVQLTFSLSKPTWWTLTATARLSSGFAYTPLVGSDINGDGLANDRAFVFDPSLQRDSALAAGMTGLLAHAPGLARGCLRSQLQRIAGPSSCRGGWTANIGSVSLSLDPYRLHLGYRGSLSLYATNVLSGLDQLIHGSQHLQGWGQVEWPNPVLLNVRGFDPAQHAFQYTVNPLFGGTAAMQRVSLVPASVTVDFRFDVGPDKEAEYLRTMFASLGRSELSDSAALKQRLLRAASFLPGDVDRILDFKDSLKLRDDQIRALRGIAGDFHLRRDAAYSELAAFLASLHGDLEGPSVREHWHAAGARVLTALYDAGQAAHQVLAEEQLFWLHERRLALSLWYNRSWLDRSLQAPIILLR
jgi:hypothetical protein